MRLLDRLEGWLGRFAVPQLTLAIIIAQAVVTCMFYVPGEDGNLGDRRVIDMLELLPSKVFAGEVWRIITFVAVPAIDNLIFMAFAWYMFYLMGTSLENHWGTFRYNVFLLTGWLATVGSSLLLYYLTRQDGGGLDFPVFDEPTRATFLFGSVFLAFAHLNPTFPIYIFFVFAVEIRWLALLAWIGYGFALLFGPWVMKITVLAAVANYLLFFGPEIFWGAVDAHRRMTRMALGGEDPTPPVPGKEERRCVVCGLVSSLDPSMEFRYCSKCDGMMCYCQRHIKDHEHVVAQPKDTPSSSTGTKAAQ
jgi:hypothetical protein